MSITLQGTVAFEPEFVGQLSHVTRALLDAGFDPTAFAISKDRAEPSDGGAADYDYTVHFGDENFVVSETDDARFLEHLIACIRDSAHDSEATAPPPGLFARVARWIAQPL